MHENQRIALVTDHFVALELFASPAPFSTHIYPRPQMVVFGDITSVELNDLAFVVKIMLGKLYHARNNLDLNFTIRTVPAELIGVKYFHWYLSIIPRLTRVAGFELGSGMFINTVLAESAAEFLRNLKLEKAMGQPA